MVKWVKIFKTEKTIEIQLGRLTEVCGKVPSEKYPDQKTVLLLDAVVTGITTIFVLGMPVYTMWILKYKWISCSIQIVVY